MIDVLNRFLTNIIGILGTFPWRIVLFTLIVLFAFSVIFKFGIRFPLLTLFGLKEVFDPLAKAVIPTKADSWQSLIWISIFSWITSLLLEGYYQVIVASIGWLFLIPGFHWFLHGDKIKKVLTINRIFIAPWLTGAIICLFLFATPNQIPQIAFVVWPIISATIAGLPKFIKSGSEFKVPAPPDRLELSILFLFNLVLSCWIQLCFSTQVWLTQYPTLRADDMSNSAFVVQLNPQTRPRSRGIEILNQVEPLLETELATKSWSQVERWLLDFNQQVSALQTSVMNQIPGFPENSLWRLEGRVLPGREYAVQFLLVWQGPTAEANGYYFSKTCAISQRQPVVQAKQTSPGVEVQCGTIEGPIAGIPEPTQ
ncbi:DUF5357 family protein [Pantanalinema rosaneae CENA516]|uniref:DUF5357 family protein n=1 Tax=Pantanalinema rosaneae TaxID=1620701 RepID=UPI003D6E3DEB